MPFASAYQFTKQFEGGYVHDPADRGGETFRGIARNFWPDWLGWPQIDAAKGRIGNKPKAIDAFFANNFEMESIVEKFYLKNFWLPLEKYGFPDLILQKLFDTSVHIALRGCLRVLQKAINSLTMAAILDVDGVFGPKTSTAFTHVLSEIRNEQFFISIFSLAQEIYYLEIILKNSSQKKFKIGWLKRAMWRPGL